MERDRERERERNEKRQIKTKYREKERERDRERDRDRDIDRDRDRDGIIIFKHACRRELQMSNDIALHEMFTITEMLEKLTVQFVIYIASWLNVMKF